MIQLTTLKGNRFYLNAELIEQVEEVHDTLITLVSGKKIWVSESADCVADKVLFYRRATCQDSWEASE